ncbi:hypothetical protein ACFL3T_00530 [Patescibacteria group bacterium]
MNKILKNAQKYSVSKKKNAQIISELNNLKYIKPISLTKMIMTNFKKFAAIAVALAVVAVVGLSGVFQAQTTYASHLENAEKALQELQMMQNEGAETNEERVKELVQEIVRETNAALVLAEEEEGEQLQQALMEVKAVQEQSMSMFQKYEGEGNADTGEALKEMEQVRERVREMLGEQSGEMIQEQTQNQEQKHLEKAEKALGQMEVMQNQGEEVDPVQVRTLAQEVVQETGSALEIAEQKQEGEEKQQALMEVQAVQEKSMNMFKNFEEDAVGEALQEAEQNHERVRKMLGDQTGEMVQEQTQVQNNMKSGQ